MGLSKLREGEGIKESGVLTALGDDGKKHQTHSYPSLPSVRSKKSK